MRLLSRIYLLGLLVSVAGCSHVFKQDFGSTYIEGGETQIAAVKATESVVFEAESGHLVARGTNAWEAVSSEVASGGQVVRKIGGGFYAEAKQGPGVVWTATLDSTDTYDVWGRIRPNPSGDSLFFEWNDESSEHHWGADDHNLWVWRKLQTVVVEAEKSYNFAVWAREDSIEVDLIVIQSAGALEPVLPE